jgi:ubiquinol-cytochrome c reductase cytochrome b subunit
MFKIIKNNPIFSFLASHIVVYPTPTNLNYMWSFGSIAGICLVIQVVTGIFLAMHYTPHIDYAFLSIEFVMRRVPNGWFVRYLHANGASVFFIAVYCHIFRGFYYGSYMKPRIALWTSGIIIFFLMMATAFIGYVLPWGQMSFWGITVITSIFSVVPFAGQSIVEWLWGGYTVKNPTLNRFYSLHYLFPFLIVGLSVIHLTLLHNKGSNNPIGVDNKINTIPFYPYFYVKDLLAFFFVVWLFVFLIFFYPNILGHSTNYIQADSIKTPNHVVPEWYFLAYFAILRAIPNKLGGILAMLGSIACLFLLPFIHFSKIRSSNFRFFYKITIFLFLMSFFILMWVAPKPTNPAWLPYVKNSQYYTLMYFFIFLIGIPLSGILDNKYYSDFINRN